MTPQQANLAPCPFCNAAARIESNRDWHKLKADHDEDCIFIHEEIMVVPAQDGPLAAMIEDWNRRAPAPTEPAVDRDALLKVDQKLVDAINGCDGGKPNAEYMALVQSARDDLVRIWLPLKLATPASPAVPHGRPVSARVTPEMWAMLDKATAQVEEARVRREEVCARLGIDPSPQVAEASQPTSAEKLQQKEHIPPFAEPASQPDASNSVLIGGWFNCADAVYATPDQSSIAGSAKGGITNDSKGLPTSAEGKDSDNQSQEQTK